MQTVDSCHVKVLMNFINQTLCVEMKNKTTLQFILTPRGFNFGGNKICFSLQRPRQLYALGRHIRSVANTLSIFLIRSGDAAQ